MKDDQEEILYKGQGLIVTPTYFTWKKSTYSTNYMTKLVKEESKPQKRLEIPLAIVAVIFLFFFLRSLLQGSLNLAVLVPALIFGVMAYQKLKSHVQTYFLHIHTTEEQVTLSFKKEEDRDLAFKGMLKALAYWRTKGEESPNPTPPKTRMERFHF